MKLSGIGVRAENDFSAFYFWRKLPEFELQACTHNSIWNDEIDCVRFINGGIMIDCEISVFHAAADGDFHSESIAWVCVRYKKREGAISTLLN